ncbi:MAG: tRNA (N(6)-L-threonylcarbamoyladenosine(37)-C(2))-methylthiotransferase MtaB [Victivallaceae bacterium]|nr:tRNA (N(6)-L-threonylcarbamoyladenosine(37)-C(2))-methylthiotransferase MtaB [Victivallaceae bacterium]
MNPYRAYIFTLGCRLNAADSALLTDRLAHWGCVMIDTPENADIIVVNSCCVTAEAARKSRQTVRHLRSVAPNATIVATGCAAELEKNEFQKESAADLVLTNPEKREIVKLIVEFVSGQVRGGGQALSPDEPVVSFQEKADGKFPFKSRAFIKVQEGCNNFCTYCIVPYTRGRERSRSFEETLADCRQAVEAGFPELVLTGVNVCAYSDGGRNFCDLVHAVAQIDGDFRIRLSSTEPDPHNLELITAMAGEPKVCRFLHLALQYGSDRILKAMNRHYRCADYAAFVAAARLAIPDIHIGTDLIVGFPGETDADFEECLRFTESLRFANMHIFTYSPRRGTPAADYPGRPSPATARQRHAAMEQLAARSSAAFGRSLIGKPLPVIFERVQNGVARGWSDNYVEVRVPADSVRLDRIEVVTATAENLSL